MIDAYTQASFGSPAINSMMLSTVKVQRHQRPGLNDLIYENTTSQTHKNFYRAASGAVKYDAHVTLL
jgi:hypothetical protein